jgi:5-methylcytosine-specific restriction protein A
MARLQAIAPRLKPLAPRISSNAATRFGDKSRVSAADRGYGAAWRKARARVLARDCGLCQVCKAQGKSRPATEVDHIINKAQGGNDLDSNLQAICKPCHKVKTAAEAKGANRR